MHEYTEHKTTFVPSPGFVLAAGNTWEEHHGEECDVDQVAWTITEHVPQSVMEYRGKQRGVHQRVRLAMEPEATGYRRPIRFAPTVAGKLGPSMLSWLLLVTGILAKFANDKGESLELLELLQDYLDGDHAGTADDSADDGASEAKMSGLATDFVAAFTGVGSPIAAGELDGSPASLAAVDRVLEDFFQQQQTLPEDLHLLAAAYVREVARAEYGGRFLRGEDPDLFVLVVGELECSTGVMAMGKVAKRARNGAEDSLEFFYAGTAPLLERGVSATLI